MSPSIKLIVFFGFLLQQTVAINLQDFLLEDDLFETYATSCINQLVDHNFNQVERFLTIIKSDRMSLAAHKIQENVLKMINHRALWSLEVILNEQRIDFTNCLNMDKHCSTTMGNFQAKYKTKYVLVITENFELLKRQLDFYVKSKLFKIDAYFLIFYTAIIVNYEAESEEILKHLGKYKIIISALMIPTNHTNFHIYTLDWYRKGNKMCREKPQQRLAFACIDGALHNEHALFSKRIPMDLNNCTLRVIAMNYPPFVIKKSMLGFELRILKEIANKLNVNFDYTIQEETVGDWGERLSPNNWSGLIQKVHDTNAIAVGNILAHPNLAEDFLLSESYTFDNMVWVVPTAQPIPTWRNIFIIFNVTVWLTHFTYLTLTTTIIVVCARAHELPLFRNWSRTVFVALRALIATPSNAIPRTCLPRIFFYNLAIYGFLMSLAYQTTLINYLTNPINERQIATMDDIVASRLRIGGTDSYRQFFNGSKDAVAREIFHRYANVPKSMESTRYWLESVATRRNTATISSRYYIYYLLSIRDPLLTGAGGVPKIFLLEKKIFTYPLRIVYPSNFQLKRRFDRYIMRMMHSGLILRWVSFHTSKYVMETRRRSKMVHKELQVLSVKDMEGAFLLLLMGYAIALIVLFIEHVFVYAMKQYVW